MVEEIHRPRQLERGQDEVATGKTLSERVFEAYIRRREQMGVEIGPDIRRCTTILEDALTEAKEGKGVSEIILVMELFPEIMQRWLRTDPIQEKARTALSQALANAAEGKSVTLSDLLGALADAIVLELMLRKHGDPKNIEDLLEDIRKVKTLAVGPAGGSLKSREERAEKFKQAVEMLRSQKQSKGGANDSGTN